MRRWRSVCTAPDLPKGGDRGIHVFFVGSYGYRKGTDLIWPAIKKAFDDGTKVHLRMQCFTGLDGSHLESLIDQVRSLPDNIKVSVRPDTVSSEWMRRYYNQVDCVFTLSRGEGWCMPLYEGLYCEKPVIAPASTAMGECLPAAGVRRIEVRKKAISKIDDPFGDSIKAKYNTPTNGFWEPELDDAASAFRDVYEESSAYSAQAKEGRKWLLETYSREKIANRLDAIIEEVVTSIR
ncbi:MAG: glycosyltransferase [Pseudomonadota bacterium]